jgi:hypothetical protein
VNRRFSQRLIQRTTRAARGTGPQRSHDLAGEQVAQIQQSSASS